MNEPLLQMSLPSLHRDCTLCFSVYAFGWGYRALSIACDAVQVQLGARDRSEQQIRLAFELNRRRILKVAEESVLTPYRGEIISVPIESL